MTVQFTPDPIGSFAPRPIGHAHVPRVISYTLDGPLMVLMGCAYCGKTEAARPNPRLRTLPWGFTTKSWAQFLKKGAEREAQMRLEAQARA